MRPGLLDQINTEFERTFSLCAEISLEMGCVDESLLAAKRVFSYNPNSLRIRKLFPKFEPIVTQINRVVESHGQLLQGDSQKPQLWTVLGFCYLMLGDFPNAFAAYAHALRAHYESPDPLFWYALGIIYAHYKYHDHGLSCGQKALELDARFIYTREVIFRTGLLHRQLGNHDSALRFLSRAQKEPPDGLRPEDVLLQIGYTYQVMGDHQNALSIYCEMYRRFPRALQLTVQYAWFLFLRAKSNDSLAAVSRIVAQGLAAHECDPTLLLIAGRIAMRQDDMATAYEHYRYCISYSNDNPFFWCGLGVLYYKNDQTQDAVIAFQRALYLQSEMAEAWLNIGLIFEQQNDMANAQKIYQTGQSKCPQSPEFAQRMAALTAPQRPGAKPGSYALIDVDDTKFIRAPADAFAMDYISAVPELPPQCLGLEGDRDMLKCLATLPKSYFLDQE